MCRIDCEDDNCTRRMFKWPIHTQWSGSDRQAEANSRGFIYPQKWSDSDTEPDYKDGEIPMGRY